MLTQQLLNGIAIGCMYALIALGYTLIFGVMRLIFFAQGELCMVGAFTALGILHFLGWREPGGYSVLIVALVAGVMGAVVTGVVAERLAIRPIRRAARTKQLIASVGVSMILQNVVMLKVSTENIAFPQLLPDAAWTLGTVIISPVQVFIIACSLVLMLILQWLMRHTQTGLHIRAVAESVQTAELDGINVNRTMMLTFVIGSVLAGFAGIMMGAYDGIAKYNMGFLPGIKGFTAAILGGFGQPTGSMVGGLTLGLAETLAAGYVSSAYKDLLAFAVLVLVLVVRPSGLLGKR